jgi:hypothetical protein
MPIYHIRVEGHLDPSWSDWLGGLEIAAQTDNETLLTGPVVDQAALHGILDKLYALNLTILAVVQVKIDQASDNVSRA